MTDNQLLRRLPFFDCQSQEIMRLKFKQLLTFSKKAVEFRDNMPIFVHAKVSYIILFGNTNIVIINEMCNISQRYQP